MKGEVYSWRVSRDTKMALELEARDAGITLAALLDRMAEEWLQARNRSGGVKGGQARLQAAADAAIGSIAGGQRRRAENTRPAVRNRLRKQHGR